MFEVADLGWLLGGPLLPFLCSTVMDRGEESMQKGVSPADMALLPSLQGWPLAGVWELVFQELTL